MLVVTRNVHSSCQAIQVEEEEVVVALLSYRAYQVEGEGEEGVEVHQIQGLQMALFLLEVAGAVAAEVVH